MFCTVLVLSLFVASLALPSDNEWIPAGPSDIRSPCPAINLLANHGFINRNGTDILVDDMVEQLATVFPTALSFPRAVADNAIARGLTTTNGEGEDIISIDSLHTENEQEHDASFTRRDLFFGEDALNVDHDLITALFESNGSDLLTREDLMAFQSSRIDDSFANNPEVDISEGNMNSMATQAVLLMIFAQRDAIDTISKALLREWLENERLPESYVLPAETDFEPVTFAEGEESAAARAEFLANIVETVNRNMEQPEGTGFLDLFDGVVGAFLALIPCLA